jgi:penicillin-binding protein 1C
MVQIAESIQFISKKDSSQPSLNTHSWGIHFFSVLLFLLAVNSIFSIDIPELQKVKDSIETSELIILDRNGKPLHEIRNNKLTRRMNWVRLENISAAVIHSLLIAEDRRFFEHKGVDWKAITDGALRYFTFRGKRGASTITMQLASILDTRLKGKAGGRTIAQKWDQIRYAQELEEKWNKEDILEGYLNLVNFKGELVGIDAASRALFHKEPHGLNEIESSIIVSFFKSPSGKESRIAERACYIAREQEKELDCDKIKEKVREIFSRTYYIKPRSGFTYHIAHELNQIGKQEIKTTLDLNIQILSQEILRKQLLNLKSKNVKDGAVLVLENSTGNVIAYVGGAGRDTSSAYEMDGVKSRRQAGSTLKPFIYGLAIENKIITDNTILNDNPVDIQVGTGIYSPSNYQDAFHGDVSARVALASSLNVPAVKVLGMLHLDEFVFTLKELGFTELREADYYGLSLALGSLDINLKELTNAYRVLANGGLYSEIRIKDEDSKHIPKRIFAKETMDIISDILSDKEARALSFGLENPLVTRYKSSVKTGTSKDMRDNWCVGYNHKYTVGVWVGNFSGEPMWNVSGVTGAAPAWRDIMNRLSEREIHVEKQETMKKEDVFIFNSFKNKTSLMKITYPANHTIIAVDPDIPQKHQAVYFESSISDKSTYWVLNGNRLEEVKGIFLWSPRLGKYKLSIQNKDNKILDQVEFEVR